MINNLKIVAYKDDEFRLQIGSYTLPINPETYEHRAKSDFTTDREIDLAGALPAFKSHAPEVLRFSTIIDATGVVDGVKDIEAERAKIDKTVFSFNGSIQSPNYLRVVWGEQPFDCQLQDLTVSYLLFSPQGLPLRAKLTFTFQQHQTPADLTRNASTQSADLTHQHEADLPLIRNETYDTPADDLHVARRDDLNNLMQLPPNTPVAGVVLLWPFLVQFFDYLELSRQGIFVNERAQARGAMLIQHLATGHDFQVRGAMALPKILCGLPSDAVLPDQPNIEVAERNIATELLEAVCSRLRFSAGFSVADLRENFLVRDGNLDLAQLPQLRVAHKPFDILMGELDWSIRAIRLPEMSEGMVVDWKLG